MSDRDPPPGWEIWHDRPDGPLVLTYRPDVFDTQAFPAACLPTVTVKPERTRGHRGRPGDPDRADRWVAELMLEPDVQLARRHAPDRADACEAGHALAQAFVDGAFDLAAAYADPPMPYLERLESLLEPTT